MNFHDPYSGVQIRFERTDKTGRWTPIEEGKKEPWWVGYVVGVVAGCVFSAMLAFAIGG